MSTQPLRREVHTDIPGPRTRDELARGQFDMQAVYRSLVIDDTKSEGCFVVDADGNVLLDLFANFALGALGYNHPRLLATARSDAFARAAANPTSTPFVTTRSWLDYVDTVEKRFAPPGMAKMFCVDAGGEGVEAALKAAFIAHAERGRRAKGAPVNPLELSEAEQRRILENAGTDAIVIAFSGAFHGRGLGPLSATHSKVIHKADLPAFPWPMVTFPASRFPLAQHADDNARGEEASIAELTRVLDAHLGRVAAILVEPIQSEGGDRHASPAFFRRVQKLARDAGAALIFDEVQTGVGITGSLWAHLQFDLPEPPDLMTFGKKMQMGGFFAAPGHVISQFGRMYQTRNGDRARAMLSLTTLETIESDKLLDNVRDTGAHFLAGLEALSLAHPKLVTEPRGRGFILAFDLPTPASRDDFLKRAMRKGVFASYTGTRSVRLRPHLVTNKAHVDDALGVFHDVAREMSA